MGATPRWGLRPSGSWPLPVDRAFRNRRMNRAAARFRNSNAKPEPRAHAPFRIAGFCFLCAWRIKSGHRGGLMIIEMRTYQIKAGVRGQFLGIFRAKSGSGPAQG